jgi:poly-gamma-glutamate capsule biosynthesis protein CapA/YwtB (metallophosphatase superfamily)
MGPTLGFTGDVMLGRNVDRRRRGDPSTRVWGSVLPLLRDLDGIFGNLECTLSTRGSQWTRTRRPFHFRADPDWAVPALQSAGFDWVSLANNHLLDYEEVALLDTIDHVDEVNIGHAGAGADSAAAREPSIVEVGDVRVGLCAFTDNTPEYAAGVDSAGVARIDMDLSEDERDLVEGLLESLRAAEPELLVASLHWGPNMAAYPDECYREFGRWLLEQGVDLVHGHSAHVFQGVERRGEGLILYDCGDFVDDYAVDRGLRNDRSFLFELSVTPAGDLESLRLRPVEISDCAVQAVQGERSRWWRQRMRERSGPFGTEDAFERDGDGLVLAL